MKEKIKLLRESLKLIWKSAPGWATFNITISLFRSLFPLALVYLLKILIDSITNAASSGDGNSFSNVLWIIIAVTAAYFLDEAASDISNFVRKQQSMKLEVYMYNLLHSKAVKLDLINFERPEYFDCLVRATREAPWRPNSILNNLVSMLKGALSIIFMAGLLTFLHWTIALLLLIINIPGIWLRLHYADVLYNFQRKQTPEARKSAYFNWLLTGDRPSREIRLFGLGNYFISLFRNSFLKTKEEEISIIRKRTMIELISDLFKASAILITLLFIAHRTINGNLTLGQMAMFLLAFRQGMIYIKDLFTSLAGLYEDSLFIGDTFEFLALKENVVAIPPVVIPSVLKKSIIIDNLSFTYPGNPVKTINQVSFEIQKGEIIALVGSNGAGKSTLVRLLCRLYDPDSGSVKYDGTDIKNMDPEKYRKFFSAVFQDFMLYNLNAGENIRLGNIDDEIPDEKIRMAANATGIHDLIKNLPDDYSTVIGNLFDNSRELSWGEWQKIALSRALFRDAPVLILDEPSSALDADTEFDIFSRFREIVKGRTSILISHRFTNVSLADRIIVLADGAIAETGTHDELMKKKGIYFNMYTKQSSRFDK
ncbi:MAG: ABC transporter ATP-binding protein/permease [Bacteroidales bacterium]|nr:ABC transporter ATP-binding protein/permease [Bacteroidales bacterium]